MASHLTILTTLRGLPATKAFVRDASGAVVKLPMKMSRYFGVERRTVKTTHELAGVLAWLSGEPNSFIIRGEPCPGVDLSRPVRRRKYADDDGNIPATFRSTPQGEAWVCFDFDKVECPVAIDPVDDPVAALKFLRGLLPATFYDTTFFAQWSASAGLDGWKTLSAHLWFLLDRPVTDDQLHLWAGVTGAPVDSRLFNAVQPHFTAAPIFAKDVPDPCPQRHMLIEGTCDAAALAGIK